MSRWSAPMLVAIAGMGLSARAHAEPSERWKQLEAGEIVREPQVIDHGERRFVGGVSYALTDVSMTEVATMAGDVDHYAKFLPFTRRARLLGENDGDRFVEMISGTALINVHYTLRFRRQSSTRDGGALRFWLDPSKPHDVPDAWGYFRWRPVQTAQGTRVLLTMGILAELPDDLTRALFQDRVQRALLSVLPRLKGGLDDLRLAQKTP